MTNPDLLALANELDDIDTDAAGKCSWSEVATVSDALRRLASSDSGVKGEPEPVAWPANLNPRTLDLVQRFALALAKKLRLAEERYGHTDGWSRDDWEAECRDHLYQHLEKGDPRDVAAYCAFMWHHGWITYRPEPVASKRPVAFRVRQHRLSNYYELYTDEKDAQFWADDRGVDYEGLYLVADRYTAPPADAGMREALAFTREFIRGEQIENAVICIGSMQSLGEYIDEALTAPGATTKSAEGVASSLPSGESEPAVTQASTSADTGDLTGYGEYTPVTVRGSTSDLSSTRSEVTASVAELARFINDYTGSDENGYRCARALLDQFEIRRKK